MGGPVVVGFDGTDGAHAALAEALHLAGALDVELIAVFAYSAPLSVESADLVSAQRERGDAVLEDALGRARAGQVRARGELVNDRPADGLASVAAEEGAQMIVVGGYGERPLKSLIVGSTPYRLLHITEVPVLVVSAHAGGPHGTGGRRRA